MIKLDKYKACICEGSSERAIIDILLDNNLLIFDREEIIDEQVLLCRDAATFQKRYLSKEYDSPVSVIRVLDSRRESFKIGKAYQHQINVINVVTAPEIEILVILKEKKYSQFKKSKKKPSIFCKEDLKMKKIKSYDFVKKYFSDTDELIKVLKEYSRITKTIKDEYSLVDLLK